MNEWPTSLQELVFKPFNILLNEWGRTENINSFRSWDELFSISSSISDLEHGEKLLL